MNAFPININFHHRVMVCDVHHLALVVNVIGPNALEF